MILAISCGGPAREKEARRETPAEARPKILQFYAGTGEIEKGGKTLLCYGVENATAVRLEPEVERLSPARNRCIEIAPARSTTYTLTAEGERATALASLTVNVTRAKPRPQAAPGLGGPEIVSFREERKPGTILLCFEVYGAETVSVEPRALPRTGALRGCFGVAPPQPTTYTLTAFGAGGKTARRSVTVTP